MNIDGANIDSSPIGATTPSTGAFTSLSATGDLTVDTSTLKVDSTNNRVGIGTATPAKLLSLSESADGTKLRITRGGVCEWDFSIGNTSTLTGVGSGALELLPQNAGTSNEFAIGQAGTSTPLFHLTTDQNYFAKKVGIGTTSPSTNLDISPSSGAAELKIAGAEGQEASIRLYADEGDDAADIKRFLTDTSGNLKIQHYAGSAFVDSMVINSSGNVGIGTSSPATLLELSANTSSGQNTLRFTDEDAGIVADQNIGKIEFYSNDASGAGGAVRGYMLCAAEDTSPSTYLAFATNPSAEVTGGSERMRIDASGRVGIGTASPAEILTLVASSGDCNLRMEGSTVRIKKSGVDWLSYDGANLKMSTGNSERARVNSSGQFFIGDSTFGGTAAIFAVEVPASGAGCLIKVDSAANASETMLQFQDAAGQAQGSITSNPSANTTAYNTSSDGRLKDITGEAKGLEIINALNPVAFTWKSSGVKAEGLIAQEVEKLVDHAVSETKESEYLQMDYSKLVTPLIKAVQELSAEVEQLKQQAHDKCEN